MRNILPKVRLLSASRLACLPWPKDTLVLHKICNEFYEFLEDNVAGFYLTKNMFLSLGLLSKTLSSFQLNNAEGKTMARQSS